MLPTFAPRTALAALLLASGMACTVAMAQDERGRKLVVELCGSCHATGPSGASPHAGAPPFHSLDDHLDLDGFVERLREGLQSPHADMPSFRFSRPDARAVVDYLRSLQSQ